ncbi:MAG: hypothetical protein ABI806_00955 [Candidatus Solibacter sp.]
MDADELNLGLVNWEHGMLLSPEHFLRQERYYESRFAWILRYASTSYGLISGGARLPETERGAKGDDPVVSIEDENGVLSITVSQCRGITPNGCFVEISPEYAISCPPISKEDMAGVAQAPIYVVCVPGRKDLRDAQGDALNPEGEKQRRNSYEVALRVSALEAPYALVVGSLVRSRDGLDYDRDSGFIPACTFMGAHSELAAGARTILEETIQLTTRFTDLHRAMKHYITLFKDRDIETEADLDIMGFVGRMVVALQNCVYEIVDTAQAPQTFFGHLRRVFHSAAVYLDLSPPVRQYFDLLKDSGETEFISLLGQQKKALGASPKWRIYEDLSFEVEASIDSLRALRKLETALEGKYIDFRVNPILEAMNFIFDRDGEVLYKFHSKSSRVQGSDDSLAITFAKLQLEGREKYRLILVGEDDASFGPELKVELFINENSGYRSKPRSVTSVAREHNQRNFEFDFDAPEVATITELRVALNGEYAFNAIKIGLLFVRQRFFANKTPEPVKPLTPEVRREDAIRADRFREPRGGDERREEAAQRPRTPPPPRDRLEDAGPPFPSRQRDREAVPPKRDFDGGREQVYPRRTFEREAPRDPREPYKPDKTQRLDRPGPGPEDPSNPPKRRRLG